MADDHDQPPPDAATDPSIISDDSLPKPIASHDALHEKIDQFISTLTCDDHPDSSSLPEIDESVHNFADLFDVKIVEYESKSKKWMNFEEDESTNFIDLVVRSAKLLNSMSKFHSDESYAVVINRISGILQRALSVMEAEFKSILDEFQTSYDRDQIAKIDESKSKQLSSSQSNVGEMNEPEPEPEPESESESKPESQPDQKDEFLGYSDSTILNLSKLANGLIELGHETECSELYFFVRRNAMEQNLKTLKFEKFSIDEMQKMPWETIEKEVSSWMKTFKLFSTSLLPSERKLIDSVFSKHSTISNRLFGNLSRIAVFYILSFAEAIMMTKRSAEKLFKFLDIFETIRDSIPEVEKLLSDEWLLELKSAAVLICNMLGESIYTIFIDLENSIKSDTAKTPVPGGAVHPLTRYTMNYLKYACEYSDTLEQIFKDRKSNSQVDSNSQDDFGLPFQSQLGKIMELLDANLESKSRLYKDPSLSLIFMMNNGRYILQKTKGTGEMRSLMGDPWVRKRSSDLRSYHTNYKRETWTKLLQCLGHEGLSVNGKVMKPVLKERFKSFNAMFDEIHRTQTTWVVSDEQLQSELRVSISAIVIPAYRSFMGRFSQVFTPGRQTEKYIKYQPEDIETCIEELFDGSTAQQSKKR